jgi:ketol-acid reductoisomerase
MGEQTILCGMQQAVAVLGYEKMVADGVDPAYAGALLQYGLEAITEALKIGGVTNMMDRLSNPAKIKAHDLADELKVILRPLFEKHQDDIISGEFSKTMMEDWANGDANLLKWRAETGETAFENAPEFTGQIDDQEFFDKGIFIVACIKAGVELAFDVMVEAGILPESAYYESLHETPLISNTIARKRLYEMNVVISDTAEYGNYLFANAAIPLLAEKVMPTLSAELLGSGLSDTSNAVDNMRLVEVNRAIRETGVEFIGEELRGYMSDMKAII